MPTSRSVVPVLDPLAWDGSEPREASSSDRTVSGSGIMMVTAQERSNRRKGKLQ